MEPGSGPQDWAQQWRPALQQAKFSLTDAQLEFLEHHKELGYKDRGALVRMALDRFRAEVDRQILERSADVYAKLYADDPDLRDLTEEALAGWPE